MRLVKCIKGWGTGMAILFFPVLVFNQNFEFGTQIWKLVIAAFIVFFPVLLFFEFVIRRFVIRNKVGLFILLSGSIILINIS